MEIKSRLLAARVIERMAGMEKYARKLGITDRSTFRGAPVKSACKTPDADAGNKEHGEPKQTEN